MMKLNFVVFLIILSSVDVLSQSDSYSSYFESTIEARQLIDADMKEEALKGFEKAFDLVEVPKWYDVREVVIISSELNDDRKSIKYMRQLVEQFGLMPQRSTLQDTVLYDSIRPDLEKLLDTRLKQIDSSYVRILHQLKVDDQAVRTANGVFYKNNINSDSIRTLKLLSLIEDRGFPSVNRLGLRAYHDAVLILLHSDFDLHNDLLGELMLDYVMSGEMEPRDYAKIIDRRCNFRGDDMYYYQAPFGYDELDDAQKDEIKIRRNKIGLRDVYESMKVEVLPNGDLKTTFRY